jgi:hypothetical protein
MNLQKFMHKPCIELELLKYVSQTLADNFSQFHGKHIYLHLTDAGDGHSILDDIRFYDEELDIGDYFYIEKFLDASILVRSDKDSFCVFLRGEYTSAGTLITNGKYVFDYEPHESYLKSHRRDGLTAHDLRLAFGEISESLEKSRNKTAI